MHAAEPFKLGGGLHQFKLPEAAEHVMRRPFAFYVCCTLCTLSSSCQLFTAGPCALFLDRVNTKNVPVKAKKKDN